jgi:calcineurin-like phosphoesterase family protein
MANIWFTADFHLDHSNILRYCNRPFSNVEEMNQGILRQINRWVKTNDILYFPGDFCVGSKARAVEFRRQIHCKTIFALPGNHDKQVRKLTNDKGHRTNRPDLACRSEIRSDGDYRKKD